MSKQLTAEEIIADLRTEAAVYAKRQGSHDNPDITAHDFFEGAQFGVQYASQPADAVEGKGVEVYEALYTPMTWESASCTLSIHFSEAGAKKAIEWHKKENDYNSEFQSYNIVKTKILP